MKAITRRQFVHAAGVLTVAHLSGCVQPLPVGPDSGGGVIAYKRSGRGIKGISRAAKAHNANRVYTTMEAALSDPPHLGDRSRVVQVTMNSQMHGDLFSDGNDIADLRHFFSMM
jgi:hypothetical protein